MTHSSAVPAARHHDHHPHPDQPGTDEEAELLELGAELLEEHTAAITAWLPVTAEPRRVVDLGCGTGAGTFALLRRFPGAEVTAVDASATNLRRLQQHAEVAGLAERVHPVLADLDQEWPELGRPDLVWAAVSMHHLADPDRALRRVRDLLDADGIFALVEFGDFPRVLPEDAPAERPGLEARAHAALTQRHAQELPDLGADWGPRLRAAGFAIEGERTLPAQVDGAAHPAVGRYGLATLERVRESVGDALDAADLAALDRLLDPGSPGSVLRRDDLVFRTERTVWAARRG